MNQQHATKHFIAGQIRFQHRFGVVTHRLYINFGDHQLTTPGVICVNVNNNFAKFIITFRQQVKICFYVTHSGPWNAPNYGRWVLALHGAKQSPVTRVSFLVDLCGENQLAPFWLPDTTPDNFKQWNCVSSSQSHLWIHK